MESADDLKLRFRVHGALLDAATDHLGRAIEQADQQAGHPDVVLAKLIVMLRSDRRSRALLARAAHDVPPPRLGSAERRPEYACRCILYKAEAFALLGDPQTDQACASLLDAFSKVKTKTKFSEISRGRIAQALIVADRPDTAEEVLRGTRKHAPLSDLLALIPAMAHCGRFGQAIALVLRVANDVRKPDQRHLLLADSFQRIGAVDRAMHECAAIHDAQLRISALAAIAARAAGLGLVETANEALREAVTITDASADPFRWSWLYNLIGIDWNIVDESVLERHRALRRDPPLHNNASVIDLIVGASRLTYLGRVEAAEQCLLRAIPILNQEQDHSRRGLLEWDVGKAWACLGRLTQAIEWFQRGEQSRSESLSSQICRRDDLAALVEYCDTLHATDVIRRLWPDFLQRPALSAGAVRRACRLGDWRAAWMYCANAQAHYSLSGAVTAIQMQNGQDTQVIEQLRRLPDPRKAAMAAIAAAMYLSHRDRWYVAGAVSCDSTVLTCRRPPT